MRNSISKKIFFTLLAALLLLQGCGVLFFRDEDLARARREKDMAQFEPYQKSNTVEAYREFITKYPPNMYVQKARENIDNLEFEPYEKADTIAAYTAFTERFPGNRNAEKARNRIDQTNIKDCERIDTIQAYRQFLEKHPDNIFVQTAQGRLQELEFRELAQRLQQKYGFDLLRYRLQVKRLQKELPHESGINLGDFTLFASVEPVQVKKYFKSHLIYSIDLSSLASAPTAVQEKIFDVLISKLIINLLSQFRATPDIDGFSFAFVFSVHQFYGDEKTALEYVFPEREARLFVQNKCDRSELLASMVKRKE